MSFNLTDILVYIFCDLHRYEKWFYRKNNAEKMFTLKIYVFKMFIYSIQVLYICFYFLCIILIYSYIYSSFGLNCRKNKIHPQLHFFVIRVWSWHLRNHSKFVCIYYGKLLAPKNLYRSRSNNLEFEVTFKVSLYMCKPSLFFTENAGVPEG